MSVWSPSVFLYFSDYFLSCALLKSNTVYQIPLSEYFVISVISFLATAQDWPTAMREHSSRVSDSIKSGSLVPLRLRLV